MASNESGSVDAGIDELWSALTDTQPVASSAHTSTPADGKALGAWKRATRGGSSWSCPEPRTTRTRTPTEVTLTADGDQTVLVVEQRGLPLDLLWAYGAGLQIHVEDLAAYLPGRDRGDSEARFHELEPAYRDMAAE